MGLTVTQQSWLFLFAFSHLHFFSLFLPCFFFCRAFTTAAGFIWAGKFFGKAFRMKGKVGGSWKKNFMGIFASTLHGFLPFSRPPLLNRAYLVWFQRSLHPAQVSSQRCSWPLTIKIPITATVTCLNLFLVEISMLGARLFVWRHKILFPGQVGSLT